MRPAGRAVLVAATLAILAAPAAAAATATVSADGVSMGGELAVDAPLRALVVDGGPRPAWIEVEGASVRVETDSISGTTAGGAGVPGEPQTDPTDLGAALLRGARPREDFSLYVAPTEPGSATLAIAAPQVDVRPAAELPSSQRRVPGRDPVAAGDGPALRMDASTPAGSFEVRGSFVAVLWEWDLAAGSRTFPSGAEREALLAPPGPVRGVEQETLRQVYVFVTDGALRIAADAAPTLLLSSATVAVDGHAAFDGASGALASAGSAVPLEGEAAVRGVFVATLRPGERLQASLDGDVEGVTVGGKAYDLAAGDGVPAWWLAVAAAAVLATAYGLLANVAIRRLDLRLGESRYREVRSLGRWLWLHRGRESVAVPMVVAALRLGQPAAAQRSLARWRAGPSATRSYLAACVQALQGDLRAAAASLRHCLSLDPSMEDEARHNPMLRPVLARPQAAATPSEGGYA